MTTNFTKTQTAQTMGAYKPTNIDVQKSAVDFRIVSALPFYIRWNDGRGEVVTAAKLKRLQKAHTWTTDF